MRAVPESPVKTEKSLRIVLQDAKTFITEVTMFTLPYTHPHMRKEDHC